ncbi:hypothetical protein E3N88_06787 [Mikania micrantha]|uniref:Uncharacterized protein n=1 Tax=Mikania micrantha TaxID=192012 RepID=A0A5N6PQF4_9ASTR|nr:hypothetical protein E3N88_06787 [Mikania micrantha]
MVRLRKLCLCYLLLTLCLANVAFQITHVTSRRVKENTTKGDAKSPNQVPDKAMKDRDRLDAFRPTTPGHSPGVEIFGVGNV